MENLIQQPELGGELCTYEHFLRTRDNTGRRQLSFDRGAARLKSGSLTDGYTNVLRLYSLHTDKIESTGNRIPSQEVSYEQGIVAPAVHIVSDVYCVTRKQSYLDSANALLPLLNAFDGKQPEYQLNDSICATRPKSKKSERRP